MEIVVNTENKASKKVEKASELVVKLNLKRRILSQFNEPMEKFLASEDINPKLFSLEIAKWNQINIEFVGAVVTVFMSKE